LWRHLAWRCASASKNLEHEGTKVEKIAKHEDAKDGRRGILLRAFARTWESEPR
jgi:hypothetical protein